MFKRPHWSTYKTQELARIKIALIDILKDSDKELFIEAILELMLFFQIKRSVNHLRQTFKGDKNI